MKKNLALITRTTTTYQQAPYNSEVASLILDKLEATLQYWKNECTSEKDYEKVKARFEEEINQLKRQEAQQLMKKIVSTVIILAVLLPVLAIAYSNYQKL